MGVRLTDFSFRGGSLVRSVFIETGTYLGQTLRNAIRAGFRRLYSIEFLARHYERAAYGFRGHRDVTLILGSSPEMLPYILDPGEPTTLWLDAHYQGGPPDEQDPKYGQCPLIEELRAIFRKPWETPPIVLIDDAHMFLKPVPDNFDQAQWPTLRDIQAVLPRDYVTRARMDKNRMEFGPCDERMMDDVIYCTED